MSDLTLIDVLRMQKQCDEDGVECIVSRQAVDEAIEEITRLQAENEEEEQLREKLTDILKRTAIAIRGPEPDLTLWSWHDLPERVEALKKDATRMFAALIESGSSNRLPDELVERWRGK